MMQNDGLEIEEDIRDLLARVTLAIVESVIACKSETHTPLARLTREALNLDHSSVVSLQFLASALVANCTLHFTNRSGFLFTFALNDCRGFSRA